MLLPCFSQRKLPLSAQIYLINSTSEKLSYTLLSETHEAFSNTLSKGSVLGLLLFAMY